MDTTRVSMWRSAVCAAVIAVVWTLAGPAAGASAQVCGNDVAEPPEACDGIDDAACPGKCLDDCTCAVCGDNVNAGQYIETCDGTDDSACPGLCPAPGDPFECICPVCGDGLLNQPGEVCEYGNDAACPGQCTDGCTCAVCGDNVAEGPESCDGTDDAACPGLCGPPGDDRACECPITPYRCASKKEQCVAKNAEYLLKCHARAELKALGPADPACLQKAKDKFDGGAMPANGCFEKLEAAAAGQCFTNDDTTAMENKADAFASAVVGLVDPSYPAPIVDRCSVGKKKCVYKLASYLLRCHYYNEGRSRPVDPLCLQKYLTKFDGGAFPAKGCFAKLEAEFYPSCMTTNDTSALESLSAAFAHDTACDLDPYQPECSTCGNNIAESPPEDCDGTDDAACPGACTAVCNCP